MPDLTVSFVIPTMNRVTELKNLLDSLVKQTHIPDEIIIVDQSDDNSVKKELENPAYQKINIIYLHQSQKSSAQARNLGFKHSSGNIICFTDDDIVLYDDYLEKTLEYFKDEKIGGLTGNVIPEKSFSGLKWALRKVLMRIFLLSDFNAKLTVSGFGFPIYDREVHKIEEIELFAGYSMNFRRTLLEKEQFDDWFTGYSFREDVDLSYRISKLAKLIIAPDVRFEHHHSKTNRTDIKNLRIMQFKNYWYVFTKYKGRNLFFKSLFYYSLLGLIFIELIQWLWSFDKSKHEIFIADLEALSNLVKGI